MIINERQYRITKNELDRLKAALRDFDEIERAREGIDPVITNAQRESLRHQILDLQKDISDYESLKSGRIRRLFPHSVTDIGQKLIEARIARGLSQRALAERLGMKEQQVQRYEQERYLTANLSRLAEIAEALGLDLIAFFEAREQTTRDRVAPNLKGVISFDTSKLPVREMKRRGWLKGLSPLDGVLDLRDDDLAAAFVSRAMVGAGVPSLQMQRVRSGSKQDAYALLAWKARILEKARSKAEQSVVSPGRSNLKVIQSLAGLSSDTLGPIKAVQILLEHGIIVVFERHLPSTYLDGAAMLLNGEIPVVGMTLRHDRLDNFWFVLAHEIGHIALHRDRGLVDSFYDDEETPTVDSLEREADEFAKSVFIADEMWRRSFVRFTGDSKQVLRFARDHKIGVSVVAGRIRRERNDYTLFSDLVGSGAVRKLMAEAGHWER